MAVSQQALNDYLAAVAQLDSLNLQDPLEYAKRSMQIQLNYQAQITGIPTAQISLYRVFKEELTGVKNGSNATFTTQFDFVPGTEEVRINGLTQENTDTQICYYTVGTHTIVFTDSPLSVDYLDIDYNKL